MIYINEAKENQDFLGQRLLPNLSSIVIKLFHVQRFAFVFFSDNKMELSLPTIRLSYAVDFAAIKSCPILYAVSQQYLQLFPAL